MFNLTHHQLSLPKLELTYLACRIAYRDTQERITLARQFPECSQAGFGYLTEVPFLQEVSPEVQLDLLARIWERLSSDESAQISMFEEAIIFAACERAVWCLGCEESDTIDRHLLAGPVTLSRRSRSEWQSLLWMYQHEIVPQADFLMLDELADLSPDEAEFWRENWGISHEQTDPFFDALADWRSSPQMFERLTGLLTEQEIEGVRSMFAH